MISFDRIIEERRSIRKYKQEVPGRDLIDRMLKSACFAPSPSHSQPVRYLLVDSPDRKEALGRAMAGGRDRFLHDNEQRGGGKKIRNLIRAYYRFSEFMFQAPYLFAVGTIAMDSLTGKLRDAGFQTPPEKVPADRDITTGLSLSAFMLKGTEQGIATCILTAPLVYIPDVREILETDLRITCFVTAGFADETPGPLQRIDVADICQTL